MKTYFLYREGTRHTQILEAADMPEAIASAHATLGKRQVTDNAKVFKVAYNPGTLDDPMILDMRCVSA